MTAPFPVPFVAPAMTVEPAWIDYNGHLNMAYYNVLFDRALDHAAALIGLGPDYVATGFSFFTAEAHVRYLREVHEGERVEVRIRLFDADAKRLHWWEELWSLDRGVLSATSETLTLHVDMRAKKVAPFAAPMLAAIEAWRAADAALPRPEGAGRRVGIGRGVDLPTAQ